jgi:hypothetical protein
LANSFGTSRHTTFFTLALATLRNSPTARDGATTTSRLNLCWSSAASTACAIAARTFQRIIRRSGTSGKRVLISLLPSAR